MLKKIKPKELKQANLFQSLLLCGKSFVCALCFASTHADTVYRCGDAYSTSNQCANAPATEVKPASVLHNTGQNKSSTVNRDLRDAQALETQRRQAERQASQTAPVRLIVPNPTAASTTNQEPSVQHSKNQGKHARKQPSPYFTAVDPNASPKKKGTAKAVPVTHP